MEFLYSFCGSGLFQLERGPCFNLGFRVQRNLLSGRSAPRPAWLPAALPAPARRRWLAPSWSPPCIIAPCQEPCPLAPAHLQPPLCPCFGNGPGLRCPEPPDLCFQRDYSCDPLSLPQAVSPRSSPVLLSLPPPCLQTDSGFPLRVLALLACVHDTPVSSAHQAACSWREGHHIFLSVSAWRIVSICRYNERARGASAACLCAPCGWDSWGAAGSVFILCLLITFLIAMKTTVGHKPRGPPLEVRRSPRCSVFPFQPSGPRGCGDAWCCG